MAYRVSGGRTFVALATLTAGLALVSTAEGRVGTASGPPRTVLVTHERVTQLAADANILVVGTGRPTRSFAFLDPAKPRVVGRLDVAGADKCDD